MKDQYAGHEIAKLGHETAGHEIAGQNRPSVTLHYYEVCSCLFMSPLGDIYAFASWQNRHFGGVFRP